MSAHSSRRPSPGRTTVAVPGLREYVEPTIEHRLAADSHIRQTAPDERLRPLLEKVIRELSTVERECVAQARAQGDQTRIWDTTRRILAMRLAVEDKTRQALEEKKK